MLPISLELTGLISLAGLNVIFALLFARKLIKIQKRIELVTRSSYYNTKDIRAQTSNVKYYGEQQLKLFEHQRLLLTTMQVQMRKLQAVCDKLEANGKFSNSAKKEQFERIKKASAQKPVERKAQFAATSQDTELAEPDAQVPAAVRNFADLMISADKALGRSSESAKKIVKLSSIFEKNPEYFAGSHSTEIEKVKVNER